MKQGRVGDQVQSTHTRPHAIRGTGWITFAKLWSRRTLPRLRGGQEAHPAHTRLRPFVKLLWAPRHCIFLHSQQGTLRQHRGVVVIRGEVSAGGLVGVCGRVPSSHGKGDFRPQHVRASGTRRQLQVRECVSNERPDSNQRTGLQMTAGECVDTGAETKKSFWARFQDSYVNQVKAFLWNDQQMAAKPNRCHRKRQGEVMKPFLQGASLKCLLDKSLFPFKNSNLMLTIC